MAKFEFKKEFVNRYKKLLGNEVDLFLNKSLEPLPKTIRVNTNKISVSKLVKKLKNKGWKVKKLVFYDQGLKVLECDTSLGNTVEHFLGYYYVQEAASMLPPLIMDLKPKQLVWDSCASPGSKSTQISQMLNNTGVVVASDVNRNRVNILAANCQRLGCENVSIFQRDAAKVKWRTSFDRVLVDAPCTATGAIRKNLNITQQWNPKSSNNLCKLQYRILRNAFQHVKQGGLLVYSTCTLEPLENEWVINKLLTEFENACLEKVCIKGFKLRPGLIEWDGEKFNEELVLTARVYPQDNDTEGFYLARIRKIEA